MRNGFTFIELIIVITFIAILSSLAIASFVNYSKTQNLQSETTEFVSTLNLAKSRSTSQTKPEGCSNSNPQLGYALLGYQVVVSTSSNSYELDVVCLGLPLPLKIDSISLRNGVTFDNSIGSSVSFFFPVIVSGVKIIVNENPAPVQGPITITLKSNGIPNKTVTVDNTGIIKF